MPQPRIASLLPSATEMVALVGHTRDLVGVSHECDFPVDLPRLPALTRTRGALPDTSAGIDLGVRELVRDVASVYEVDLEAFAAADPTVVITQDLCDVCAVSRGAVEDALRHLASPEVRVVSLSPLRLADVWEDIRRVGRALDAEAAAERALAEVDARVEAVRSRAEALRTRPRVLTIEWLAPFMVGGTWMPELVSLAGGETLVTEPGQHAPTLDLEALAALEPDVVLFKPCGFPLRRTLAEGHLIDDLLAATDWPATRTGAVYAADGNAYFNRPGPRLVDSLEILAACAHPEEFGDLAEAHRDGFGAWSELRDSRG